MERPSRESIYDALTCDSSAEGCDGDWRFSVLENADPKDVSLIKGKLSAYAGQHTDSEIKTTLENEGVLERRPSAPGFAEPSMRQNNSNEPKFYPSWNFDQNR